MPDQIVNSKRKIRSPVAIIPGRNYDYQAGPNTADKRVFQLLRELETTKAEIGVVILTGIAQGDILFYDGTEWINLHPGILGQALRTGGAGANPAWGFDIGVSTTTTSVSLTASVDLTLVDTAGGAVTITLPTAVGVTGRTYTVKKISADVNAVTVNTTGGQTIDGVASIAFRIPQTSLDFVSDGINWRIE